MIQKENNKVNTDQAWSALYARLQQDSLVHEREIEKSQRLLRLSVIRWAAAVALVCVISTAVFLTLRNRNMDVNSKLLTLHNEKGAVTLVTTLEDGSIVYLADNTRLQYPEHFAEKKREVVLNGNALFDVTGNRSRPFLIDTDKIRIEVIGTAFNVQSTDYIPFELSVQRGEVKVTYKKSGESLHVKAGETVSLESGKLQLVSADNINLFNRFTERVRFKDEKLSNILRVINRKSSGITLQAAPSLENRQLTVTFANDSPETIAELICVAFNLKCVKENNVLLISEP